MQTQEVILLVVIAYCVYLIYEYKQYEKTQDRFFNIIEKIKNKLQGD